MGKGYFFLLTTLSGRGWNMAAIKKCTFFWGPKKRALFNRNHVPATTGQSCQKKKVPFSQMNISLLANFGSFFGKKRIFGPFSAFRQNVKTAVSPYIRPGPGPLSLWVIYLLTRMVPTSFVKDGPKLGVLAFTAHTKSSV